jgi:hypothetical protein
MRLTLEADQISQKAWYIDGACAVHEDWKSHSGSFMTFGKGMMNGNSTKQKLNTTSSTHAEVVAVHDNMGAMLCYGLDTYLRGTYRCVPGQLECDAA